MIQVVDHEGWTPLMIAAQGGHESTVALLLESGIDVNKQAHGGERALMLATLHQKRNIIDLLLNFDVDPLNFHKFVVLNICLMLGSD